MSKFATQLESVLTDAARYRFLRDHPYCYVSNEKGMENGIDIHIETCQFDGQPEINVERIGLDEAIDILMGER